jgi:hypothetical protein
MELVSCHCSFEVNSRFLENFCTPALRTEDRATVAFAQIQTRNLQSKSPELYCFINLFGGSVVEKEIKIKKIGIQPQDLIFQ